MATSYKAVLKVKYSGDTVGIVNIRKTVDTKSSYYSLKIRVPGRYWNKKSGTVRKTDAIDYLSINSQIAIKIKELEAYKEEAILTPIISKHSFIAFFENFLKRYDNPGSKIKYETVLAKLKAFLKEFNKADLLFHEIDSAMVYDFRDYCRKKCSVNTTAHYLKLINQVINNVIALNHYNYTRHPFLGIDFKKVKVNKVALQESELIKILNAPIEDSDVLFNARNCFITQVFLQGMRISDLQLLRWGMIQKDCIEYRMFKTDTFMSVYISDIVWQIFIIQFKKLCKTVNIKLAALEKIESDLEKLQKQSIQVLRDNHGIHSGFNLINYETINEPILKEIESEKNRLFLSYKESIRYIANQNPYKNLFIFDFLQQEDFKGVKNNDLSDEQYRTLKNKSIVYNRHLKLLQAKAGLNTVLKSHLSRSSYASMLLNSGIDVYNISAALGHSGLNITEKYLAGFNRNKTQDINKQLADKFYKP